MTAKKGPGIGRLSGSSLLLLCVWAASDGAALAGTIRHDRDPQSYLNLAQDPAYASAGRFDITRDQPGYAGSGTLVGDRWVLTAAHLLEGTVGMTFNVGGQDYPAEGWRAHQRYDGNLRNGYDLALVKLRDPVAGVAPATLYRGKKEQHSVGTFVGFGRTGDGLNGGQPFDQIDNQKRAGVNLIDGAATNGFGTYKPKLAGNSRVFVVDFDNPTNPADSAFGSPSPTDLEFLIAQGDSGGPVFIDLGQGAQLAGIHSFGEFRDARDDSDYGDVTGHTRVSAYNAWIRKAIRRGEVDVFADLRATKDGAMILPPHASAVPEPAAVSLSLVLAGYMSRPQRRSSHVRMQR